MAEGLFAKSYFFKMCWRRWLWYGEETADLPCKDCKEDCATG